MKVVFDAYWWVSGPPSLRHVLREIVLSWSRLFPEDALTLVVRRSQATDAALDAPFGATLRSTGIWPQGLAVARAVPAAARAVGADLVLTHNFAVSTRASKSNRKVISAVYLHDVLFVTNPEWFTAAERAYFSLMLRWISRADIVFTSSASEAARITEFGRSNASVRASAVVPVGLGLSAELTGAHADEQLEDDPDPTLLPRQFVLTVGRLNVRKNLAAVIEAALASGRISPERPLVIVGSPDGKGGVLSADARRAISTGSVRYSGFVSEPRLRWYYRNTSLFVFLSLGEGFGMPPVEAAYFSALVLASDLPVFHETLGSHARYVDPTSIPDIAAAIASGVDEGETRLAPLRPRASVATQHDWNETVRSIRSAAADRMSMVST